uniref:glutathione transferase n=1 Tax=Erpetoichthys calabaricus TaxID=27687 RepID=A0A8C4RYP2_ERPCA
MTLKTNGDFLGYWDIRGLAQPMWLLLKCGCYGGSLASPGSQPTDKSCWFNEKDKLGLDFPTLPYLIYLKVIQTNANLQHTVHKHNMCGRTEDKSIRVGQLDNQLIDFHKGFVILCYNPKYDKGDRIEKLTFIEFILYELLDKQVMFEPTCLKDFKTLDKIAAYMRSKNFMKHQVNNKMTSWGNKKP